MAITQETTPQFYHPAHHKIIFEASSSIVANDEFRFVFVITSFFVNRTIKVSPRPVDGWGFLDLSRHTQDMINPEVFDITEADDQDASFGSYSVRINEEYKDGNGDLITVVGPSFAGVAFNTIFNRNDILTYNEADYKILNSNSRFLWNIENRTKVLTDDIFFIHYALTALSQTFRFYVKEFFKNGTTNEFFNVVFATNRLNHRTCDLAALLTDPANTVKIELRFATSGAVDLTETKTLLIEEDCSIYQRNRFVYLDQKGSYNSLNFDQVSRKETTVNPKTFEKFINGATETGTSRSLRRYFVLSEEVFTVNSSILTDRHNIMIADLIKSTDVYLDVRNDARFPDESIEFVPVEILTKNVKELKSENQELNQQTIRFRFSFDDIAR